MQRVRVPAALALLRALRHRDFCMLYVGQSVSFLGDMVFHVALSWQVLLLGGDAATLGLVLSAYMAAQVALLLLGGVIVDRFPRRDLLLASDATQGALVAALAVLAFLGLLTLPILVAFALVFGAAAAIAMPALNAFVPETVPQGALASANSLHHGTRTVAMVAGPALGGLLIDTAGTGVAFALDAATFAVSLALLAFTRRVPAASRAGRTMLGDVREGFRYVLGVPWLWITIALFAAMNVAEAGPRNVALPLLVADELALDASALGLVLSASAVGSFLAVVAVGAFTPSREKRGLVGFLCVAASGVLFAFAGLATTLPMLMLAMLLKSAALAPFNLLWETAIGDSVEPSVRGRVISLDMLGSFAFLPVAMAGTGALSDALGPRVTFVAGGVVIALCGLAGALMPAARKFH